jgi:mono/diheme cytochrome c family protein
MDLRGDLLFAEPVGRLVRRAKIEVNDGQTRLRNAYDHTEFLRSTDPNFRPVNLTTGPDGCLYLVDMYRGIIQEGNWVRPGSYLRGVVEQYGFDKNIGHGRIWRIVHDGFKPGPWPAFQNQSPAQLVPLLENPNGWWRDTAQKLIVLHGDHSVVPALEKVVRSNPHPLARIHALWTLEGLIAVSPALLQEKFQDADPHVRAAAIRVSESLYPGAAPALVTAIENLAQDPDPDVTEQSLMTLKRLKIAGWENLTQVTMLRTKSAGVRDLARYLLHVEESLGGPQFSKTEVASLQRGQAVYRELCFSCHGLDGRGMPLEGAPRGSTIAPPLAGAKDLLGAQDAPIYILLHGLSGPIENEQYQAQMVSMASNDDQWIADVISYVRNAFGNHAPIVTAAEVNRLRRDTAGRTAPWTLAELHTVLPQPLTNAASWRLTASQNVEHVRLAADGKPATRWDTSTPQIPGMWFQIELPDATTVSSLVLDAGTSTSDYPRSYRVELSVDGQHWGQPVATGNGASAVTQIQFPPQSAKFIRITQTGKVSDLFWSIHELQINTPGERPKLTKVAAGPKSEFE